MLGRPSVMTEDVVGKLREAFLMGCTDQEACIYAHISKDTLYEFQKRNPDFSDQKRAWKNNPVIKAKMTIYNALDKPSFARWYLERTRPEEFSKNYKPKPSYPKVEVVYVTQNHNS